MVLGNFVYLHTVKGVATICPPYFINVNKLKMYRNVLNLNLLRSALRKISMSRGGLCLYVAGGLVTGGASTLNTLYQTSVLHANVRDQAFVLLGDVLLGDGYLTSVLTYARQI